MNQRTKALQITTSTKKKVWERQKGKSVVSGKPITWNECCCHYVSRARGGLGIEENIVGMTYEEHMIFDLNQVGDHLTEHKLFRRLAREHLEKCYPGWAEEKVIYRKWKG